MIKFLARIFIKNHTDYKNAKVRNQYGILCGITGICFNLFLFSFKLFAGLIANSVSVVADAFNNLSDAAASVVTILGFKISGKKPDAEHPFGHGRMEYIAGLIVSFLIILMGYELLKSSVGAIKNPEILKTDILTIIILSVSILVKCYMYFYNHFLGKKISSVVMEATAKDSLNDTISTFVVLCAVIVNLIFSHFEKSVPVPLDGIAGIFVALFILKGGFDSVKETVDPLLGKTADKDFVRDVEKTVLAHPKISGIHDFILHDYGPGKVMVSLHAEVPGDENIFLLHDEIDNIEVEIAKKFNCSCVIHMDPVDKNNEEIKKIKDFILEKAKVFEPEISIHDLRMVPGPSHTNVIFDAVRPFSSKYSEEELKEELSSIVKSFNENYCAVIQIDQPFV